MKKGALSLPDCGQTGGLLPDSDRTCGLPPDFSFDSALPLDFSLTPARPCLDAAIVLPLPVAFCGSGGALRALLLRPAASGLAFFWRAAPPLGVYSSVALSAIVPVPLYSRSLSSAKAVQHAAYHGFPHATAANDLAAVRPASTPCIAPDATLSGRVVLACDSLSLYRGTNF